MKKLLTLLGVLISIGCFQAYAERSKAIIEWYQTGHVDRSTTVRRSPTRIPIDVYYDEELRQIEISSDMDMDAQIFVCDENGNTLDYSPCINVVLNIPYNYSGFIILRIESEEWIATGKIIV